MAVTARPLLVLSAVLSAVLLAGCSEALPPGPQAGTPQAPVTALSAPASPTTGPATAAPSHSASGGALTPAAPQSGPPQATATAPATAAASLAPQPEPTRSQLPATSPSPTSTAPRPMSAPATSPAAAAGLDTGLLAAPPGFELTGHERDGWTEIGRTKSCSFAERRALSENPPRVSTVREASVGVASAEMRALKGSAPSGFIDRLWQLDRLASMAAGGPVGTNGASVDFTDPSGQRIRIMSRITVAPTFSAEPKVESLTVRLSCASGRIDERTWSELLALYRARLWTEDTERPGQWPQATLGDLIDRYGP